jgi:hypothetical protein
MTVIEVAQWSVYFAAACEVVIALCLYRSAKALTQISIDVQKTAKEVEETAAHLQAWQRQLLRRIENKGEHDEMMREVPSDRG